MSVHDINEEGRLVELGNGTTNVSLFYIGEDKSARGIMFSNLNENEGKQKVFIDFANVRGVFSYLRAIADMLSTWNIVGEKEEVEKVQKELEEFRENCIRFLSE